MSSFSLSHWVIIGILAALYWAWRRPKNTIRKTTIETQLVQIENMEDIFVDRNIEGMALEKSGRDEEAVALYELNLKDGFDGSHPYDRLRIFYSHKGMYDDAIRVCQAYIDHGQKRDLALKAKYVEWIKKYQFRREKQQ